VSGTLRFDVEGDRSPQHWLVTFDEGAVTAVESRAPADCIVTTDKATLAWIIEGRTNEMSALLRGLLTVEGRGILVALFRSILQGAAVESHEASNRLVAGRHS
jgi:putative sterol carrier protein